MDHPIRWQHFEPATRKAAVAANRPILLLLTMPWCQHSRDLLAAFRDPQVVRLVGETVVPVHVDAQRRPDVDVNLPGILRLRVIRLRLFGKGVAVVVVVVVDDVVDLLSPAIDIPVVAIKGETKSQIALDVGLGGKSVWVP